MNSARLVTTDPSVLVLAGQEDLVAREVAASIAQSGYALIWLTPADLGTCEWVHHVDDRGVWTSMTTRDRRHIVMGRCSGILNRLTALPSPPFARTDDREYAAMEQHALLTSILAGVDATVVNPVSPPSLAGPVQPLAWWLDAGRQAGLPVRRLRVTTDGRRWRAPAGWEAIHWQVSSTMAPTDRSQPAVPVGPRPVAWAESVRSPRRMWVVDGLAVGEPSPRWKAGAEGLAARCGCTLLEISVAQRGDREWVMVGAEPCPRAVPETVTTLLVQVLVRGAVPCRRSS